MLVFLSHNSADKETARSLGALLKIAGADVWFDEWAIKAGDSIPGKLDSGLSAFDTFVLLWSKNAARSKWVRSELETAITRGIGDDAIRIIPVRLDAAEMPPLLKPLRYIDLPSGDFGQAVQGILGVSNRRELIKAIQGNLEELGVQHAYFHGYGVAFGCPKCGASVEALEGWQATDYSRDDTYAGAKCRECGWEGGGEV